MITVTRAKRNPPHALRPKQLREIAAGLNERGMPTARGGQWSAVQVQRVMEGAAISRYGPRSKPSRQWRAAKW
jgi:hypothetical protein